MRTIRLGDLQKGRTFWYNQRKFKVTANLGVAGVAVLPQATKKVRIGERTFVAKVKTASEVWTASAPVEVRT